MRRLIGFGLFLVSGLAAWLLWGLKWNEWEIWLAIAVLVAGLIAFGYLWFAGLPARIDDSGVPHFENPDYERYFRELNGIADPR